MSKIGIIGAMEVEVEKLKDDMADPRITEAAGMTFCEGKLMGRDVVVVRSGIGKVNAAVCTQILIDRFRVDTVINTGIAGSLDADIDIGDIVLSTNVLYHDMDAVHFGYALGQIPQMNIFSFPADEELINRAEKVCNVVNPEVHVFKGRIVSGDQFVAEKEVKDRIVKNFGGLCTEMEGAAVGHTAWLNKVPFVIIRAISDKADNSATMDYPVFEKKAAEHSVRLVEGLLADL